jgi:hypothetical protein
VRALGLWVVAALWCIAAPLRAEDVVVRLDHLANAPYAPVEGAPQVIVQRPSATAREVDIVLYLHGYDGCIEVLAASSPAPCRPGESSRQGWDLLRTHREAQTATWFVLVQLAFSSRNGRPGRFAREGQVARFLEEVVARVAETRGEAAPSVRSVTLAAHSAAFETSLAVVRQGGLGARLQTVLLLDAMYSGGPAFLYWAAEAPSHTLVALATPAGTPARRAEALRSSTRPLRTRVITGDAEQLARVHRGSIAFLTVPGPHREVPGRYLATLLRRLFTT